MSITEMIEALEAIRADHGDLSVHTWDRGVDRLIPAEPWLERIGVDRWGRSTAEPEAVGATRLAVVI
jgi:hypothetical protein